MSDLPGGSPLELPVFVSTQVTDASRYFLNLSPKRSSAMVVVCGGCERMGAAYRVERKTFPYLCIEFVADGAGTLWLRGKRHPLRPGMAFAYGPGIPHLIQSDPLHPMRKFYVDFVGREATRLFSMSPLGAWKPVQIAAPQEVLEIFAALQRDANAEAGMRDQLCAAHLRLLLLKTIQKALPFRGNQPRSFATYQRARGFVEEHFAELNSAEDIARACHITPVYLSRVFSRFGKNTPYYFLMRLKMNRATELLLSSGMLVKEVAEELHFSSQFQFSRAFKRIYGLSPEPFVRYFKNGNRTSLRGATAPGPA